MKDILDVAIDKGVEKERERCLKICDDYLNERPKQGWDCNPDTAIEAVRTIRQRIERGE